MGCKLSTPAEDKRRSKPRGIGHTERLMSDRLKAATATISAPPTVSLEVDEEPPKAPPKLNDDGKLMPEEVIRRTSSSLSVTPVVIGNKEKGGKVVQIQYAYRSQRGYYPDDPMKANQDKFGITLNFAGENGDAIFSVYDGHGTEGHDCAAYAKKKLPQILAKYVRQKRVQRYTEQLKKEGKPAKGGWNPSKWPLLGSSDFEQCCRKAFKETNENMHDVKNVEDKLSGTTAATVCFHGGRVTVCNVGDSRVILGHEVPSSVDSREEKKEEEKCEIEAEHNNIDGHFSGMEGDILPIPLTRDQTPYRKDERERVIKLGAEIKSIDQLEGRDPMHDNWGDIVLGEHVDIQGDPPRVWVKGYDYPGTAFTRSLGDRIAEDIGVTADPEIVSVDLTINDKFLVIASDGIFEFLSNQQVINMCAVSLNPLEACEMITKAAYDQWLQHENRTDDITIIVLFLSSTFQPPADGEIGTTENLVATVNDSYGAKPMRVFMYKPNATVDALEKLVASEVAHSASAEHGVS